MKFQPPTKVPKWPFFLGNVIMLALAYFIGRHGKTPMEGLEILFLVLCGLAGAAYAVAPFFLEYRAVVKQVEAGALVSTVKEIRNLEMVAAQINAATARWQVVQELSANSITAAKEIAEKINGEAAAFSEFLGKANDAERGHLRLEVDKLRRMENEWLQVIMRLLDHTYALYKAAERSGQPGLIDQLERFQNSCRDVARRIGLAPVVPGANEAFDPQWHQPADPQSKIAPGALIHDTIATGFTYQGRMVRPALVSVQNSLPSPPADGPVDDEKSAFQKELEEKTLL